MRGKLFLVFLLGAITGVAGLLGGCLAISPPNEMDNSAIETYEKQTSANSPAVVDDEAAAAGLERWKDLVSEFSEENLRGKVADVYAEKFFFNDTLKTFENPEALEEYLLETAAMLKHSKVSYEAAVRSGADTYVRWKMVYRSKKLSPNDDIVTIGMSHLRFDEAGKVILHQDFWDSTRGIFEHVPVIGHGIRFIKKRL